MGTGFFVPDGGLRGALNGYCAGWIYFNTITYDDFYLRDDCFIAINSVSLRRPEFFHSLIIGSERFAQVVYLHFLHPDFVGWHSLYLFTP
ncbi:TPA: hypothetical protein N3A35_001312 [Salmonella enterica subsp. salamae serovar 16:m,t:e,n,x]|nr:hypothetical protein [Salmonella enterica subsp. salamae serovar 16:m,t:e,n,x]